MALAYDLIILLDPNAEDDAQAKVLSDVEASIAQAGGTIANNQDWGQKVMAFKMQHKPEARYRLIQFTGPPTLPESLNRYLQINDAVLRHRLIHTPGGEPPPAPAPPSAPPAAAEAPAAACRTPRTRPRGDPGRVVPSRTSAGISRGRPRAIARRSSLGTQG